MLLFHYYIISASKSTLQSVLIYMYPNTHHVQHVIECVYSTIIVHVLLGIYLLLRIRVVVAKYLSYGQRVNDWQMFKYNLYVAYKYSKTSMRTAYKNTW